MLHTEMEDTMKPTLNVGQVWKLTKTGELYLVGMTDADDKTTWVNFFSLTDGGRFFVAHQDIVLLDHNKDEWTYEGHISEWSKK